MALRLLPCISAILLSACASSTIAAPTPLPSQKAVDGIGVERDGVFVALWQRSDAATAIKAFSTKDGQELGTVLNVPQWPATIYGPHRAADGALWYTVTTGPRLRSNVAGGDPAPNSCTGSVIRFDPVTGRSQTILHAPASVLISDAIPSPDAKNVAYLAGGCDTSFFNMHLVIRQLSAGTESTIGLHAKPCHLITTPSWSADGSKLVFAYWPPTIGARTSVYYGTCPEPQPGQLVIVPSARSSEIDSGTMLLPSNGCSYTYATFDAGGIAAVEGCGENRLGPARLVQLTARGEVTKRFDLHPASDPTSLSPDRSGNIVLVNEYQSPEYSGNKVLHGAYVWIQLFDGHQLQTAARYDGDRVGLRSATF